ncbi:hypothetical protein [Teredinibacter haidensis]|uniref:hypothetical protein n=1 Tax=Teredinibacter haidensis TaxID=2731755 RepID=UPI00163C9257|nr:hypothetical protein [Teredinibacter haidensis]
MKLSAVVAVICCTYGGEVVAAEPVHLSAPTSSDDGSYVLRIQSSTSAFQSEKQGMQLEVYRNKDGGEFKRIMTGPRFSALSELVRENGRYGYKARWAVMDKQETVLDEFSEPVFIDVSTPVPRMVKPRSDRLVGTMGLVRSPIN